MRWLFAALLCLAAAVGVSGSNKAPKDAAVTGSVFPARLSEYGFFNGRADRPSSQLIAYRLRTPLFSDYAEKQRFLYLPADSRLEVDREGRIEFPVGTALIKSFGYPAAKGKLKIIETRLLLHRTDGWVALPYVWRADGSDADLKVGGARLPATIRHADGRQEAISYAVPNKNQCKQCHSSRNEIEPIGSIWQNMIFSSEADRTQLRARASFPRNGLFGESIWDDPKSGTVEQRALAYLRVNCGHCHRPTGSASNSGLFYDDIIGGEAAMGIGKRPVAAGRGAGNFDFVIEPGHPERSILLYRMKSTDPGIAMPEVGRATVHVEGVALLEQWIKEMKSR